MPNIPPGSVGALEIVAGGNHTCARMSDGTVRCWGDGSHGQLGSGTTSSSALPVTVASLSGPTQIAAGELHTCASLTDGTARCWGANDSSQLGDSTTTDHNLPVPVIGLTQITGIAAGGAQTCALLQDCTVRCWGGSPGEVTHPYAVEGMNGVVQLSVGTQHACARQSDGTGGCWGDDSFGQLGNRDQAPNSYPFFALDGLAQIAAGDAHTCARLRDGTVRCCGANPEGRIGDGTVATFVTDPRSFRGPMSVTTAIDVTAGKDFTCAVLANGTVQCWGGAQWGQLGDGTSGFGRASTQPVTVMGIDDAIRVAVGTAHACALRASGSVACWGAGGSGQLGDGSQVMSSATPVAVRFQ